SGMWEYYRITVTDPDDKKSEYFYDGNSGSWYVSPENYIEYQSNQVNNGWAKRENYLFHSDDNFNFGEISQIYFHDGEKNTQTDVIKYDSEGRLISWTEKQSNRQITTKYEYTSSGLLKSVDEALVRKTVFDYVNDKLDLIKSITYPQLANGSQLTKHFDYDASYNVVAVREVGKDAQGIESSRVTSLTYNDNNQVVSIDGPRKDVNDVVTLDYYDCAGLSSSCGQLKSITNALGHVTYLSEYTLNGKVGRIESPNGLVITVVYDDLGRIKKLTQASSEGELLRTLELTYEGVNRLKSVVVSNGESFTYHYTASGALTSIVNAQGEKVDITPDKENRPHIVNLIDSLGAKQFTTQYAYNRFNALTEVTASNSSKTKIGRSRTTYTGFEDADGYHEGFWLDELGRAIELGDSASESIKQTFDADDSLLKVTAQNTLETVFENNVFGEVLKRISPDTGVTENQYDDAGNVVHIKDARGTESHMTYDALNRLVSVITSNNLENVTLSYDSTENGNQGIGRLTKVQDDSGVTEYFYNDFGAITKVIWKDGNQSFTTEYLYDAFGQLEGIVYPSGKTVNYHLDKGQVKSVSLLSDGVSKEIASNIEYLPFGPMVSMTFGNGLALNNQYNLDYHLQSTTIGNIFDKSYDYTTAGNLRGVTDNLNPLSSVNVRFDERNQIKGLNVEGGFKVYGYDFVGNRTKELFCPVGVFGVNTLDDCIALFWDTEQNCTYGDCEVTLCGVLPNAPDCQEPPSCDPTIQDCGGDTDPNLCDDLDTVCSFVSPEECENLRQLCAGGMLSADMVELSKGSSRFEKWLVNQKQKPNSRLAFTPTPEPKYTVYNYGHGDNKLTDFNNLSFSYDAAGNMRSKGGWLFEYNHAGRLASAMNSNHLITYKYNANGLRTHKTANGVTTRYIYNQEGVLIAEVSEQGDISKEYIYLNKRPLAMLEYDDIYYYHNSHIGTPEILTDSQQFVVWQADYDLWGSATILVGDVENNLRFTGQYFDSETSLHYNWNRYYDPMLGRYITSDPIGLAGGINTYLYVSNSPFSLVDPNGEFGVKGALIGVGLEIGLQMYKNAGRWWCIDLFDVLLAGLLGAGAPSKLDAAGNLNKGIKNIKTARKQIKRGRPVYKKKTKSGRVITRQYKKVIDKEIQVRLPQLTYIGVAIATKEALSKQGNYTIKDLFESNFFKNYAPHSWYKFFKSKCTGECK
ncbi:RHS repeat-associated core domain-containing protein, partial [Pleionea sp. CnH1-48]|uniref:RHS repeat-associated core domain-containing protein n=1 Tax=Pleionea sp. CnH1-48 TaxID=2954494 RepID=UPI0020984DCB